MTEQASAPALTSAGAHALELRVRHLEHCASGAIHRMNHLEDEFHARGLIIAELRAKHEALVRVIREELENREDIDDNGNANEAMQLLIALKEAGVIE